MLQIIGVVVVIALAVLLLYAAMKPHTFRIERAVSMRAAPEKIFPLLNDFHQWELWSPWEKDAASLKRRYSGPSSGEGAVYEWSGERQIGQGRMEILAVSQNTKVVLKIDFTKPMEAHNTIEFTLARQGDATLVTQAMYGPHSYLAKLITVFFPMDKMVGPKFEAGLANLRALVER